ncbi:MAG: MBOAT family protein [Erysipelotrichaceae bacterium]|nr:MBOAT family protein [Erysipelotrichaceae bacterium]
MVFSSIIFLFWYLPVVLAVMKLSPLKWRNAILFVLSLIFYGWSEPFYIVLMLISTVVDYFNGRMVEKYLPDKKKARRFVIFSVVFNMGLLGFFKYADWIIGMLNTLGMNLPLLGLTLPVGISFYSFQTMSYPIDVYRGEAKAQKNIVNFGAYVVMFPQLIAGPIVRYRDIDDQLRERSETMDKFVSGIERFVCGLCKKVLLANTAGLLHTQIQSLPQDRMSALTALLSLTGFALQIYFDFSGYSCMAIGLGRMFGFELMENFNYPYISRSITEFWRRWHISLSTFFRDYVYIPLGGNRKGKVRQYINIMTVWFLTGLWHGASWNFVLWGVYFGVLLMIEKAFFKNVLDKMPKFFSWLITMILVWIGWVFFAFEDTQHIMMMFKNLTNVSNLINADTLYFMRQYGVFLIICMISSTPWCTNAFNSMNDNVKSWLKLILVVLGMVVCTASLINASFNPFLYFRF